jgi:hypothetical protein
MQKTLASAQLSRLDTAVLETVVYSDLFDFPLTREEVWRWLPRATTHQEVENALSRLIPAALSEAYPYVTLPGREHIGQLREQRYQTSATLWVKAERYGRLIARLPLVRMVAVTGSLAVQNADSGDDIDYLIVTANGRVWLARAMTMLVVRFAALRGVTLCPNFVLSESALALPDHDLYTARELLQMTPIGKSSVYAQMLSENVWWRAFLPNLTPPHTSNAFDNPSFLRSTAEWLLRAKPFNWLEAWLLAQKGAELTRRAASEAVFDASMCKGHFEGWHERTSREVQTRMQSLQEAQR